MNVAEVVVALGVAAVFAAYWVALLGNKALRERARLREHVRASRAYYAAIEAAEDDPSFSPEVIEKSVVEVLTLVDRLWRAAPPGELQQRPDAEFVAALARSREAWLGNRLQVTGAPSVDLLRIVNREGADEDRVIVRVQVRVRCKKPRLGLFGIHRVKLDERWTLGRTGAGWILLSVDGDPFGGPVLTAPLIPNRSFDGDRLLEESLAEMADAQKPGDHVALGELIRADDPPPLAMLDLSVVDGRFLPPLIAVELGHLLEAWEIAISGSQNPLDAIATADAKAALLWPRAGLRLVMRDAVLKSWEATRLELSRRPPAIEVRLDVEAVRFVEAFDNAERFGNDSERRPIALTWLLELTTSARSPWRLTASSNPAAAIPGWS